MNLKTLRHALELGGVYADTVGKNKEGQFVIRKGFFYRMGNTADSWRHRVTTALTAAGVAHGVVKAYEHWAAFRGGASIANQSHWAVVVEVQPAQH